MTRWGGYAFGGGGSGAVERESGRSATAGVIVTWTIAGDSVVPASSVTLTAGAHDAKDWQLCGESGLSHGASSAGAPAWWSIPSWLAAGAPSPCMAQAASARATSRWSIADASRRTASLRITPRSLGNRLRKGSELDQQGSPT